jgi:DNA helicase II / ATP-dependent DNA helicase PcrA
LSSPQPPHAIHVSAANRELPTTSPEPRALSRCDDFLIDLNPEQRDAVLHTDGPLLILAGAGSGKTRVIAYRIAYLIGGGLAAPHEVLAVTFTNKASDEMRERVAKLIGDEANGVWLSTFHALCARILRRDGPAIGLSRDFVIYDSADQLALVRQVQRELRIDEALVQPRVALARISHAKNRMEAPSEAQAESWNFREAQFARIHNAYVAALAADNAVDFDDLLLKTVELVEKAPEVRRRYATQFRYVMIDEYQDTNRPQYLLARRFVEQHRNLAVVGDPDQSIYKWRGADVRNILDFERDFPEARIIRLERNYRSTQTILDAASAVISRNRQRKEKRLWTEREGGARVLYFRGADELEEADYLSRLVRRALAEEPDAPAAILYRVNSQSRAIEDALIRDGLPYRVVGGVRFYERKEIKDTLAYLKLLVNPHDEVSFRRVLNTPPRGNGKSVVEALEAAAGTPGEAGSRDAPPLFAAGLYEVAPTRSLWTRAEAIVEARQLPPRGLASLSGFLTLVRELTEVARSSPLATIILEVLQRSGYLEALRDENTDESRGRIENLQELVSAAREFDERDPDASLATFVDRLSLLSEADEVEGAEGARVWLMTLHAAKGLEFPLVAIAGMEEGLFPHSRALENDEELEEERRLCYVGMTRAQSRLALTGSYRRRVFGEYTSTQPSRFIEEVPPELLELVPAFGDSARSRAKGAYTLRRSPYGRRGVEEQTPSYAYEDENQALGVLRAGQRVRHPRFGVGTVVGVEGADESLKLTVRFPSVGQKKLVARFARLELA